MGNIYIYNHAKYEGSFYFVLLAPSRKVYIYTYTYSYTRIHWGETGGCRAQLTLKLRNPNLYVLINIYR